MILFALFAQSGDGYYVLRGEVFVDFEPIYAGHIDPEYPLDITTAGRRALEEAAMLYSAMIYGWSFHYDIGERARGIEEKLELTPIEEIRFGDPFLRVTDTEIKDMRLWVWTDYHLDPARQRRILTWKSGTTRTAQAAGYSPSFIEEYDYLTVKKMSLEDAARSALRTILRSSERNRPKEAAGFISLSSFPRFFIDSGRWACSARFNIQITEIIPFAAY